MKFETEHAGRKIVVEIDERDREHGQICIAMAVDDKERWVCWMSDHGPEEGRDD